jgi:hypothetical protein
MKEMNFIIMRAMMVTTRVMMDTMNLVMMKVVTIRTHILRIMVVAVVVVVVVDSIKAEEVIEVVVGILIFLPVVDMVLDVEHTQLQLDQRKRQWEAQIQLKLRQLVTVHLWMMLPLR